MNIGDKVIFTGCSEEQRRWGNHTGDINALVIGNSYTVEHIEVHSWHTKVYLKGFNGSFNSVCFEDDVDANQVSGNLMDVTND